MLPLSDTFTQVAAFSLLWLVLSLTFYAVLGRSSALAWSLALLASLLLGLFLFGNSGWLYDAGTDLVRWLLVMVFSPVAALVLAIIARGFAARRWIGFALIFAPPFLASAHAFERQTVPTALCGHSVLPVDVAGTGLRLPMAYGAHLQLSGPPVEHLSYAGAARNKEDVRRLCDLSAHGGQAVRADMVWIAPLFRKAELAAYCTLNGCGAHTVAQMSSLGSLRILRRDETSLRYELSYASQPPSENIFFEGDGSAGRLCTGMTREGSNMVCRIWSSPSETTVISATSRLEKPQPVAEALAEMQAAQSALLSLMEM